MLDGIIKKLQVILGLCLVIGLIFVFTPLGDLINGEVEQKVKEFKEDTKKKIDAKKEEIKEYSLSIIYLLNSSGYFSALRLLSYYYY